MSVEDVGRHNAADAIAGRMWLDGMSGEDKILFTTGRMTSEIMMKTAFMGIPVLISRSGVTQMSLELARDMGMVVIGRAKASRFLVYNGADHSCAIFNFSLSWDYILMSTSQTRHSASLPNRLH